MYIIKSFDGEKEIGSYINYGTLLPSVKEVIDRFHKGTSIKLYKIKEVDDNGKEILEMVITRLPYINYMFIQTYTDYIPTSFVEAYVAPMERTKQYSIVMNGENLESVTIYDKHVDIVVTSLYYSGNNLHGTQLMKFKGNQYTVQYNHGRLEKMHKYTGGLFSFGTRLEEIEINEDVLNVVDVLDKKIRALMK